MTTTAAKHTREEVERAFEDAVSENRYCSLGKVIAESEHGDIIKSKVDDNLHYSAAVIARVLKRMGYPPISSVQISKHRQGVCKCVENR